MEYRQLGASGFKVPELSFGTGTFGGGGEMFKAWGTTDVAEATRLVDICLEAGLNMFDSADIYSAGMAEEILGQAIKGRRDQVIISTKATFRAGKGPNDVGSSRHHLIRSVEQSLRRLGTDYIDLFQLHGFDAVTPIEEVLRTLDDLVRAGKLRYLGCSNFSGWHLMKSLRGSSGILLAPRARLRMGTDAAGAGPESGCRCLEPTRLGTAYRQDPPRTAIARQESATESARPRYGPTHSR
jgi:aryl-alcohol dehydrogenase-like predicted oxidoreductase